MTPCQCDAPGRCPVFNGRKMDATQHRLCSTRKGYYEVFAREAAAEPPLPSLARRAANFGKAAAKHVRKGRPRASDALVAARLAVCQGDATTPHCTSYRPSDKACSERKCGCYVEVKATWQDSTCPRGLWPSP